MTLEELLIVAEAAGYHVGNMFQTPYVLRDERRIDAWSAHFVNAKGEWIGGAGKTANEAVAAAIAKIETKQPCLEDFI